MRRGSLEKHSRCVYTQHFWSRHTAICTQCLWLLHLLIHRNVFFTHCGQPGCKIQTPWVVSHGFLLLCRESFRHGTLLSACFWNVWPILWHRHRHMLEYPPAEHAANGLEHQGAVRGCIHAGHGAWTAPYPCMGSMGHNREDLAAQWPSGQQPCAAFRKFRVDKSMQGLTVSVSFFVRIPCGTADSWLAFPSCGHSGCIFRACAHHQPSLLVAIVAAYSARAHTISHTAGALSGMGTAGHCTTNVQDLFC